MCSKKVVRKVFGGGGGGGTQTIIKEVPVTTAVKQQETPAVSVDSPMSDESSNMSTADNTDTLSKKKGKNSLRISRRNSSYSPLVM